MLRVDTTTTTVSTTDDDESPKGNTRGALLNKICELDGDIEYLRAKHARELTRATTSWTVLFFAFVLGYIAAVVHRDFSL